MRKLKKNRIVQIILLLNFFILGFVFIYVKKVTSNLNKPYLIDLQEVKYSKVYDASSNIVETLGNEKELYIKFDDLPKSLINALISIEDKDFFNHDGINPKRIVSSFFNNLIPGNKRQGGSTITQQLIKNMLLTGEISLQRKVQEAYLAFLLEQELTKEEILVEYFNRIYFEPTVPGVRFAALRYFGKDVSLLSVVESSILASLVKSPSLYNPFKYPERVDERKKLVLKAMYNEGYITLEEYNFYQSIKTASLIIPKGSLYQDETFRYQSYLDVVYLEVIKKTGLNPYQTPLKIETYLDSSIQTYVDNLQEGKIISFPDDDLQFAFGLVSKENAKLVAISGGRNYHGKRLLNRAYQYLRQPASTMKPIFTYLLAMEYLHYNEMSVVSDKEYTYPNSTIVVENADKKYLGDITLLDALGYSRNTSTLYTLEKVIDKIGIEKVEDYLKAINIMDEGTFAYPYAIGGMKYGVSPINLSGAYRMILNDGKYLEPSTISKITRIDTNEVIYTRPLEETQVVSRETSSIMTSTLTRIINQNYNNINIAKPSNVEIAGKTGTNGHSKEVISKYHYPSNADKDIWFAGYSPDYALAVWTGFDEESLQKKNYFYSGDSRRSYAKKIFKAIINEASNKDKSFLYSPNLVKVDVVKGIEGYYLPNIYVPKNFISYAYFRRDEIPSLVLPDPNLKTPLNITTYKLDSTYYFDIKSISINEKDCYENFFGEKGYLVEIIYADNEICTYFSTSNTFDVPLLSKKIASITIYESYTENQTLRSEGYLCLF